MSKNKDIDINVGRKSDSFESLKDMCIKKSEELKCQIEIPIGSSVKVTFWTNDIPELICVGCLSNNNGEVNCELNFEQSTL